MRLYMLDILSELSVSLSSAILESNDKKSSKSKSRLKGILDIQSSLIWFVILNTGRYSPHKDIFMFVFKKVSLE